MATANTMALYEMGKRMRDTRIHCGKSQTDIAVAVGVDKATLSRFENGVRMPDLITIGKIADEMNVPMDIWFRPAGGNSDNAQEMNTFLTERREKLNSMNANQIQNLQRVIDAAIQMASI